MTSGNGLSVTYTSFNKPATITRGTASISFDHDPEHQRYAQTSLSGVTLYLSGGGVLAERFAGSGGSVRWTNYLIVGGRMIGIRVENSDETSLTRYFHTDHLGSIAVITNEAGAVMERLSYDAWGVRRNPDGSPSGAITSETTRGFTGHEHLEEVGLIHMNGRVYDPLLARFGTPDPTTENPFSTQGWNRYSYVGNSPVNFTDPSGYCFLGCFWKPVFKAIGQFFQKNWGAILQIAAAAICQPVGLGPVCAAGAAAFVTGVTSGNLGMAIRAGFTAFFTATAMSAVGTAFPSGTLENIAGHALVGCMSAVMGGGKCGPGALSAGLSAAAGPMINGKGFSVGSLVANAVIGGVASVAAGGNFANGAVTAAFGYLFNEVGDHAQRGYVCSSWTMEACSQAQAGGEAQNTYIIEETAAFISVVGTVVRGLFAGAEALFFSQTTASPFFSAGGTFAGQSIASVAAQLRAGTLAVSDVTVGVVSIDGTTLIVNTRSALALMQAGIPQSSWAIADMTSNPAVVTSIMARLVNNGLTTAGTSTLRITQSGRNASTLVPH